jgi:hypothetical protein
MTTPAIFAPVGPSERVIIPIANMMAQVVAKPWTEKMSKLAQKLLEHIYKQARQA